MAQDNVPGAMTTQNTSISPYNPQTAAKDARATAKLKNTQGEVKGQAENLRVRPEHVAKEQKKQQLINEGKLAEAERSRYQ